MTGTGRRQHGQAVIEALLMLPLMGLLLWGVAGIGSLQFSAQQTTQASRKAVMSGALGQPLQALRPPADLGLSSDSVALPGVATQRVSALQDEWFGTGLRMLSVEVRTQPRAGDPSAWLPIARRISVASGAGYANGDADTQRRLGAARTGWRQAGQISLSEATRMQRPVERVDGPWGRPKLSLDWLSTWADVVPAERLGDRREQSR
ncbi:TadE/TadG family type IV pilus assembly protein [Achromobacter deleyi]|uniref:TadE/TadG family type IV pilus assembly protein n=1 Tax=Achromobacter deleyi TaxID=1353891 RepID=UPI001490A717|nr:TadE/TadG family type IV pilus assembly protein [Achromobacter deleyi]QVQ29150.1 pilus assembly protein [Achromobacter deleyi]UIP19269.1 pilus assembly protein [Achromobacter deleyi]